MNGLSEREKSIAAAAYLKGLAVGLSIDRGVRWHQQVKKSELLTTPLFNGLVNFLSDGRACDPLVIFLRNSFAARCGLAEPHHEACLLVRKLLHPE